MDALLIFLGLAGLFYMLVCGAIMWQMGRIREKSERKN